MHGRNSLPPVLIELAVLWVQKVYVSQTEDVASIETRMAALEQQMFHDTPMSVYYTCSLVNAPCVVNAGMFATHLFLENCRQR